MAIKSKVVKTLTLRDLADFLKQLRLLEPCQALEILETLRPGPALSLQERKSGNTRARERIPPHWLGTWKGWQYHCTSLAGALVEINASDLATHALVIGATGSGKTIVLHHLIAGLLFNGHSVVLLDARGDLAMAILELAARLGIDPSKIRFFNLREKKNPLGFNPLAGNGEAYYRALGLIDAVMAEFEALGPQVLEYFRNAVLALAETGEPITRLEDLFYSKPFRASVIERVTSETLRQFWMRYDSYSSDKQAGLASAVMNKVAALFATEGLRRMLGHPQPVDLGAHLRTPGSITLISLAVDELHQSGWTAGSLFLSSICREVFSQVDVPESKRNRTFLIIDEFENFVWNQFESVLAEGRRFKFAAILSHQSLAQLTPKMRSLILGNVGVKLVFRTSHADAEILNRDLTGQKGTFNLASLSVGEAILWRRGDNPWPIEISRPLIADVGRMSPAASELLDQLAAQNPPYYDRSASAETPSTPATDSVKPKGPLNQRSLEDWLE